MLQENLRTLILISFGRVYSDLLLYTACESDCWFDVDGCIDSGYPPGRELTTSCIKLLEVLVGRDDLVLDIFKILGCGNKKSPKDAECAKDDADSDPSQ